MNSDSWDWGEADFESGKGPVFIKPSPLYDHPFTALETEQIKIIAELFKKYTVLITELKAQKVKLPQINLVKTLILSNLN